MFVPALFVLGSLFTTFAIGLDAALYLLQRHQLSHALLDTVRAHTRQHMQPEQFAQQLRFEIEKIRLPLPLGWPHSWHAEQHRPTDADFMRFRDPHLEGQLQWPHPTINNRYQAQQHSIFSAHTQQARQTDAHNLGPLAASTSLSATRTPPPALATDAAQNIFAANTLQLRFSYAFRPTNPIVRPVLRALTNWVRHPYSQKLFAQGLLPIVIELEHPYASHPVAWPEQSGIPYYRLPTKDQQWHKTQTADYQPMPQLPPRQDKPDIDSGDNPNTADAPHHGLDEFVTQPISDTESTNTTGAQPADQIPWDPNRNHEGEWDCDHPNCCLL